MCWLRNRENKAVIFKKNRKREIIFIIRKKAVRDETIKFKNERTEKR